MPPTFRSSLRKVQQWLGLEWTSIEPVAREEQVQRSWWSVSLLWFSCNFNLLTFATGMLAPQMGLGLEASMYTILGFTLPCSLCPAYFCTFGPKLGMRQLIQARYSFGYAGTCLIALLAAAGLIGYCTLNSILGGEALQAVSPGRSMSPVVGIVIVAVVSTAVSFCGIKVLQFVEMWLWFPVLICFCILAGLAGSGSDGLHVEANTPPAAPQAVLGMGCVIAGFQLSWSGIASDVSLYLKPQTNPYILFACTFAGFSLSSAPIMMLGAAFAASAQSIPTWKQAISESSSPGPLFDTVLSGHVGGFGKFLTVILALSAMGNIMTSVYSFGIACQTLFPPLTALPRFLVPLLALAIFLPTAIVGRNKFYDTLSNFVAVIGYWSALYIGVLLADHVVIRRMDFDSYNRKIWNRVRELPYGLAALGSAILALGLLIPLIDQAWFTGPLAERSGDLGFEVGLALSFVLYCVLRPLELRILGH